jgi:hypothetical protein
MEALGVAAKRSCTKGFSHSRFPPSSHADLWLHQNKLVALGRVIYAKHN